MLSFTVKKKKKGESEREREIEASERRCCCLHFPQEGRQLLRENSLEVHQNCVETKPALTSKQH